MILRKCLLIIALLCGFYRYAHAQQALKGTVQDSTGAPLAGVTVHVKGATTGTGTDAGGNFSLSVPADAVLVFSYIGYQTKEVPVGGQTTLNVTLSSSTAQLQQLVVIGYGTAKKVDLTGSITTVKGEDLARMPATNPVSSLQGKVAGLTIVNSGRAGTSPTVRIRGVNSTNNSNPLYVVDGVFQSNIDYLNPADIESIEVLRDPSSIAIFGLQGGSGVIIVTTKRAAKGETRINFQSNVGVQHVTRKIDVADAAGFKRLYNAQRENLGDDPFDFSNYTANTDWQDLILRDAVINTNTLSISNSGDKTTTYVSLGFNNQDGVLKYDNYKKYIARINEEITINEHIKVGADLTGFYWSQQTPGADLNNALWAAPVVPVKAADHLYYSMPSFQRAQVGNPVARLDQNTGNAINNGYRAIGNLYAEIKFLQHFTFKSAFYADLGFDNNRSYTPLPFRYINIAEGDAATDTTFDETARTSVAQTQTQNRKFQQDHTLTFDETFADKHHLTVLAGFTTLYSSSMNLTGNRKDTVLNIPDNPIYWYLDISNQRNPGTYGGGGGEEAYMSFLGRVGYTYREKYLLNATFRRDGVSKFSPAQRWGNFGSLGVGWVASEEPFFKDHIKGIDFLKFRGAWGQVGNALGTDNYLYLPVLNIADVGVFGDNVYPSVSPKYIPDPRLHWEVVNGIDLGLELRALDNRLSADINFYNRTTKDILTYVTLPGTAGNYSYYTNLGDISNKGVEVSLGWSDRIGKDFTYSISPNFSYNENKVKSIGNEIDFELLGNGGVNRTATGSSIGYFYGYKQTGIYQSEEDLDRMPHLSNSRPGDIAYANLDGDTAITPGDRTYLGTPFPKLNFGINLSFGYRSFDLLIEGQGVAGNKIYTQRRNVNFAVVNYETNRLKAWTGPGTSDVEPILDNTRSNNLLFSSYFLEPGDYFRLRTLQIGYTFRPQMKWKTGIRQLRVYLSGQNIKTWTKATGYTPEAPLDNPIASGADNGVYPVPAVYSMGVNVTF